MHKFVLSARSPYFAKLSEAPEITTWKLPDNFPPEVFNIALRYLYLGDPLSDIDLNTEQSVAKDKLFRGLEEVSKLFDIKSLWDGISSLEMRIVRQRYEDEVSRGRKQIDTVGQFCPPQPYADASLQVWRNISKTWANLFNFQSTLTIRTVVPRQHFET